jgi:hypothetical protein
VVRRRRAGARSARGDPRARAYESFVAPGAFVFRRRGEASRVGDVLTLCWDMAPADGGEPAGGGREFLILDAEDRIRSDHQFIDR